MDLTRSARERWTLTQNRSVGLIDRWTVSRNRPGHLAGCLSNDLYRRGQLLWLTGQRSTAKQSMSVGSTIARGSPPHLPPAVQGHGGGSHRRRIGRAQGVTGDLPGDPRHGAARYLTDAARCTEEGEPGSTRSGGRAPRFRKSGARCPFRRYIKVVRRSRRQAGRRGRTAQPGSARTRRRAPRRSAADRAS